MTRLPPTPTLFPYTTLFRSVDGFLGAMPEAQVRQWIGQVLAAAEKMGMQVAAPADAADGVQDDADAGDRKSTRLNSSHTVISYAVFCLKKKKREYQDRLRRS